MQWKETLAGIVLAGGVIIVSFWAEQSDFYLILPCFLAAFAAYGWGVSNANEQNWQGWLIVAIALRVLLVFSFPGLSDDIYRFLWDGHLWLAGENPFNHLPSWYAEQQKWAPGHSPELYAALNSPEYYTIYPPVAQFTFMSSAFLSPNSWWGASVVMKVCLLLAELGGLWAGCRLLARWKMPPQRILWYALNPLLIVEVMGNLHFEGVMIAFLLLGVYALEKHHFTASAITIALSIASKLLPLLFLPFFIRRLGWWKSIRYFAIVGLVLGLCWLPLLSADFLANFSSSVDLYFQRFEFNGSFYYLLRAIGYWRTGYNQVANIGPYLALLVFVVVVGKALVERQAKNWCSLPGLSLFAITVYLLCATTVHPWYTALPVVLCLYTPWRWPIVWSGMITLTYINYSYGEYYEPLWIVGLEYIVVLSYMIWESLQYYRFRDTTSS